MAIFNCKSCGGDLEIQGGTTVVTCEYCGRQQTVPSMDNEKKVNLFNRANRLRSKCDFDKAASVYESIVAEFPAESEAYWGLCLCKFGIEYVDDPATANKIPTCHRTSYESIFDDSNFDLACENADALAVNQLRNEAKEIDRLQKEILNIAKNEEPFDVFICYKESDENGGRTVDSELAHDIYDVLTEKGYKVFYSRITLKAKLGQDYEPYIFSALNSAKVMLSIGTKFEYFNAVWVKNEWSRFLSLMKNDKSKMLIPCYRDIDPYDMPKEFNNLQGQDLSSPRAFQDLVSNIEKIIPHGNAMQNTIAVSSQSTDPLIKRAFMCLDDDDWDGADKCCEKILDIDPENYDAYFVKFCIDLRAHNVNDIVNSENQIDEKNTNFQRALKFGNESQKQQLKGINKKISDKIELRKKNELYNTCLVAMRTAKDANDLYKAADMFKQISGFKDSNELSQQCRDKAVDIVNERSYQKALNVKTKAENCAAANMFREAEERFKKISGYRDSAELAAQCREKAESIEFEQLYNSACSVMHKAENEKDFLRAQNKFSDLGDFKDSPKLAEQCRQEAMKYKDEAYNKALDAIDKDDVASLEFALKSLNSIKDYKDSEELIAKCEERLEQLKLIAEKADAVEAKKEKRRNTIAAIISMTVVAAAVFMIVLAINVFIPRKQYSKALALEDSGNYGEAMAIYTALNYSDSEERAAYCQDQIYLKQYNVVSEWVKEGKYIDALQKEILNIAKNEEPFDVFICYKESDENGGRTVDSELAHDIYDVLTEKGYKVFYSRITLKAKLGQDYEPYIFSALNSAKVMLSIGTKFEYFNAVWVKNEWSRFLSLMKNDKSKMLIPCYRDIDPYDMPKEFGSLQGQDLSSPRAFQDLVSNIEKIIPKTTAQPNVVPSPAAASVDSLLKRAFMCLEDGDWSSADECCEKILDANPENAQAYLCKLMMDYKVFDRKDLGKLESSFSDNPNYKKVLKFGDETLKREVEGYIEYISETNLKKVEAEKKDKFDSAITKINAYENNGNLRLFEEALDLLRSLEDYKDSREFLERNIEKIYQCAIAQMDASETISGFEKAEDMFRSLGDYKDSLQKADHCAELIQRHWEIKNETMYDKAIDAITAYNVNNNIESLKKAIANLSLIPEYKDSQQLLDRCKECLSNPGKIDIIQNSGNKVKKYTNTNNNSAVIGYAVAMIIMAIFFILSIGSC